MVEAAWPSPAEPSLAEPSLAEPSLAEPSLAEPNLAEPNLAEPNLAEPSLIKPGAAAEPALAALVTAVPVASTIATAGRVRAMRARGIDVVSLTLGEPGFDTPPHVVDAAHAAALRGDTKYPPVSGTAALIAAVRAKFRRERGLEYAADQVLIGHGGRQIIYNALTATLDPGSEIIIPAPYWNAYPLIARLAGAHPVFVPCRQEAGFLPDPDALAAAVTPHTRWLVLNFPNNPSGAVCPPDRLAAIGRALRPHRHVWIMCDDIYEQLVHASNEPGREPSGSVPAPGATMATVAPELGDRLLTVGGVSKTYAMTGWRVGYAAGPARLIDAMAKLQGQATGGVSPIAQAAALAALEGPQEIIGEMRRVYARRCCNVASRLAAVPGLRCAVPQGAFYLFPDVTGLLGRTTSGGCTLASDGDVAAALLEEAHVATVAGRAFGASPHLRLSVAADDAELAEACRRIEAFCRALV